MSDIYTDLATSIYAFADAIEKPDMIQSKSIIFQVNVVRASIQTLEVQLAAFDEETPDIKEGSLVLAVHNALMADRRRILESQVKLEAELVAIDLQFFPSDPAP